MNWTTQDAVSLRDFHKKCPHFIEALEQSAPRCTGDTVEERATSGSERQGWQDAVAKIKQLMTDPTRPATDPKFIDPNQE